MKPVLKEEGEVPVNNASGGEVAGLDNNPPVNPKKKKSPILFKTLRRKLKE